MYVYQTFPQAACDMPTQTPQGERNAFRKGNILSSPVGLLLKKIRGENHKIVWKATLKAQPLQGFQKAA